MKIILLILALLTLPTLAFATTTLFPQSGGTGITTIPMYGQVLVGNAGGTYTLTATSSLGITEGGGGSGTVTQVNTTYPVTGGSFTTTGTIGLAFGTSTSNTWGGTQTFTNPIIDGTLSGLIAGNNGTTYASATSTLTASSPLTGSFTQVGTGGSLGCQAASGSQAGCLSSTDWTTFNGKQAAGNYITALTGDGTAAGPGSVAFTLATVNSNVGTFTYPSVTVNGKGLVTAISNGTAPTTYTGTFPISVSGSVISFGGLSTTTNLTVGQLPYITGANTFGQVATTSVTCSGTVSCSPFTVIGASPITLTGSASGGSGTVSTSTHETAGSVAYWTSNSGTPALLGQTSTSTISNGTNITVSGGPGYVLGSGITIGLSGTIAYANGGTGTTTAPVGQLLYGGTSSYQSVATSSAGAGTGLSFSGTSGAQVGGTNGTYSVNTTQNITTLSNLTVAGFVQTTSGGVLSSAALTSGQVTTALGFTPFGASTLSIANGGTGSTTVPVSQVLYGGTSSYQSVATSSETCTGPITCTAFNHIGAGGAISLGTVGVGNGGTGITTIADGALIFGGVGGGTANLTALATSTSGNFLQLSATTGRPIWSSLLGIANGGTGTTTGGVTNGVEFYNGTNLTNTANFVELANGNIGIGTTTPFGTLSIATTSAAAFSISDAFNTIDALFGTASTTGSIFTVAATTSPSITSPIKLFDVDQYGGITASSTGATPAVSCTPSGGTLTANSNDESGSITSGSLSTACTFTFAHTKLSAPVVVVTGSNTTNFVAVTAESTTAFTVTMQASSGDVINYFVVQP